MTAASHLPQDAGLPAAAAIWCNSRRVMLIRIPGSDTTWWYEGQAHTDAPASAVGEWATIPPLLDQLRAATVPSGESGKGAGRGNGGGPDWDALDILDRLRGHVQAARALAGLTGDRTLAEAIRQVTSYPWPAEERDQLARVLHRLAADADAHLTPADVAPTRYVRDHECPQCHAKTVAAENSFGEQAQVPALRVVLNRGLVRHVECQACGSQWDRAQLAEWASVDS